MPFGGRAAVETKPGGGVDELAVTVDEVRHPERIIAQIDCDFTPLAKTQELTLNGNFVERWKGEVAAWISILRIHRAKVGEAPAR
jgi:hypothetical protein